ncbi:MAG: cysteine synthase A [Deltaproteobacteria bacterium]|nr:MAG: cysteine synthase A [Deltaproteobacteria bacterium]
MESVLEAVGGTPLVRLRRLPPEGAGAVYVKCEQLEPAASVKDRIALSMIEAAERDGRLAPGGTVIEPTSGNTGVGLALACAAKGYRCILTMPADMSLERRQLLECFGAEVVLTDPDRFMEGAIEAARDLAEKTPGAFIPGQFENPANPAAHRERTGPEIADALEAEFGEAARLDALVVGVGTGGTLSGAGAALRERFPELEIVAVEPARSPVLAGGEAGLHRIQGIGAGFVPPILDRSLIDRVVQVSDEEAWRSSRRLALEEGLLVGISSGANVHVALQVAAERGPDSVVVTFLCDTGERYFSLFEFFGEALT